MDPGSKKKLVKYRDLSNNKKIIVKTSAVPQNNAEIKKKSSKTCATNSWFVSDKPITLMTSCHKFCEERKKLGDSGICTAAATTNWFVADGPITSTRSFNSNVKKRNMTKNTKYDSMPITASATTTWLVTDAPSTSSKSSQINEELKNSENLSSPTSSSSSEEKVSTPEQVIQCFNIPSSSSTSSQENEILPKLSHVSCSDNFPKSTSCEEIVKTPKQSNSWCENVPSTSVGTSTSFVNCKPDTSVTRSSLSTDDKEKIPCAFYRIKKDKDGKEVFSKQLLKYFLNVDTPEVNDLRNKRFNTSFLRETPKPNREIKIFTEEEDNDPKYLENIPKFEVNNLPDVPGSLHADIFKVISINESDEELKKVFKEASAGEPKGKGRKRRSTRIAGYDGKPLPDQSLFFDYSSVFSAEDTMDSKIKKENELLRQKYKNILGEKELKVELIKLPESYIQKLCSRKDVSAKPQRKKRIPSRQKPKVSKRIKRKSRNLKSKRIRVSKRGKKLLSKK